MKIKKSLRKLVSNIIKNYHFKNDFKKFEKLQIEKKRLPLSWADRYPIINENTRETKFDAHYIYHPAWAARILAKTQPALHIDISSTLHFCSIVSSFIKVEFYDYRPVQLNLENLLCKYADLLALPFSDHSVTSLSCMHVIEHIGLGRYGDPLDPDGDIKAISELKRVMKPGGDLIIVVPIGKPCIRFNAHRIYEPSRVLEFFDNFNLLEFAVVTDNSQFLKRVSPNDFKNQKYACGCFHFEKKKKSDPC